MLQLGLIGENISHSKSPTIHKALLAYTQLEGDYGILDVPKANLKNLLNELKAKGYRGVNVTVPHKQNILPFLDELSDAAEALQVVNTIVFEPTSNGVRLIGHNTDVAGFWACTPIEQQQTIANQNVVLLGAGGAARAVLATILPRQPKSLTIVGQSQARLNETFELAKHFNDTHGNQTVLNTTTLPALKHLSGVEWLINATPIGTGSNESPLSDAQVSLLPKTAYVSDLVYYPSDTQLLKQIRERGLRGQNGLGMLMHQAMAAFTLWTNLPLEDEALICIEKSLNHV